MEPLGTMNLTRDALGATIKEDARRFATRGVQQTADIQGATVAPRRFIRGQADLGVGDIAGTSPSPLHVARSGHLPPNFVSDIDKCRSQSVLLETRRSVDPLQPAYTLPSFTLRPITPLPFKRDLYSVADIDGARAKPFVDVYRPPFEAVSGSRSLVRSKSRRDQSANHSDVRDINQGSDFKTSRCVDPLEPVYSVHGRVIDADASAHPAAPRAGRSSGTPNYSLKTDDIEGATAVGALVASVGCIPLHKRRHFLESNRVADIEGAQASTLLHKLPPRADHPSDPNERDYRLLEGHSWGAEELLVGHSRTRHASVMLRQQAASQQAAVIAGQHPGSVTLSQRRAARETVSLPPAVRFRAVHMDPREAELATLRGQLSALTHAASITTCRPEQSGGAALLNSSAALWAEPTTEHRSAFSGLRPDTGNATPAGVDSEFSDARIVRVLPHLPAELDHSAAAYEARQQQDSSSDPRSRFGMATLQSGGAVASTGASSDAARAALRRADKSLMQLELSLQRAQNATIGKLASHSGKQPHLPVRGDTGPTAPTLPRPSLLRTTTARFAEEAQRRHEDLQAVLRLR